MQLDGSIASKKDTGLSELSNSLCTCFSDLYTKYYFYFALTRFPKS